MTCRHFCQPLMNYSFVFIYYMSAMWPNYLITSGNLKIAIIIQVFCLKIWLSMLIEHEDELFNFSLQRKLVTTLPKAPPIGKD